MDPQPDQFEIRPAAAPGKPKHTKEARLVGSHWRCAHQPSQHGSIYLAIGKVGFVVTASNFYRAGVVEGGGGRKRQRVGQGNTQTNANNK